MCVRRFSAGFGEVRETAGALWDCPLQYTQFLLSLVLIHWNSNHSLLIGVCVSVSVCLCRHSRQLGTDLTLLAFMSLHTECQSNFSIDTTICLRKVHSCSPNNLFKQIHATF